MNFWPLVSVETRLTERDQIDVKRGELQGELTDLRGRIERIEEQAIEAFNAHMETVLELLDYANIARTGSNAVRPRSVRIAAR